MKVKDKSGKVGLKLNIQKMKMKTENTFWPGGLVFQHHIFLPFHTVHGVLQARTLAWFATLIRCTTFCQNSSLRPSVLGGPAWHAWWLHWVMQAPSPGQGCDKRRGCDSFSSFPFLDDLLTLKSTYQEVHVFLLGLVWCPSLHYAGCQVQGGGLRGWSAFSFQPPPPSPAMLPMRRSPCCPGWPPWSWGLCSTALGFGACLSFLSNWIYLHIVMAGSLSLHRLFWSHDKLGVCSGCGVHSCWAHGPELRLRSYGAGALLLCHTWVFVTQGSHLCPLHWQADS